MTRTAPLDISRLAEFPLPVVPHASDKDARGRVLVVGGGAWGPGAALLSALAALRAGAGKLQVAAADRFAAALAVALPEAAIVTTPSTEAGEFVAGASETLAAYAEDVDAVVIGPGILDEEAGARLAMSLAAKASTAAFVIDAGALTGLPLDGREPPLAGRLVVTPHAGEMAKLLGRDKSGIEADPLGAAREVAQALKAVVVLKGGETLVVTPDGHAWRHADGVVGLATSGSGDVLAGIIGGLLARGAPPLTAAAWGVCVHGRAGERLSHRVGRLGFLARELLDEIAPLVHAIEVGSARAER